MNDLFDRNRLVYGLDEEVIHFDLAFWANHTLDIQYYKIAILTKNKLNLVKFALRREQTQGSVSKILQKPGETDFYLENLEVKKYEIDGVW